MLTALIPAVPARPEHAVRDTERRRDDLRYRLGCLELGRTWTQWQGTPLGDAERAWQVVANQRGEAERRSHDAPLLKRHGFARRARELAERAAPLSEAYKALVAAERTRLLPRLAEAENAAADLDERVLAHRRFGRDHPEVPKRLAWLEREMRPLDAKVAHTRTDLDDALGQDWKRDDPSWDESLTAKAFPVALSDIFPPAAADAMMRAAMERATRHPEIEHDLGPDLGLGL